MHIHVHVHAHECVCRHVTVPCAWPSCACTLVYTTLRHSLLYQSPIPMPALPSSTPHCPALAPIILHPHGMQRLGHGGQPGGMTINIHAMHTHIHIPATLPIISGPYRHSRSFPKAQAYLLLPHVPPLTHAMPELSMGGKPWGQKGGRSRVGGSAEGDVPLP